MSRALTGLAIRAAGGTAQKARQSTQAFTELARSCINWLADRIIDLGKDSPIDVPFVSAAYLYRLRACKLELYETEGLNAADLELTWKAEQDRGLKMIEQVKSLAGASATLVISRLSGPANPCGRDGTRRATRLYDGHRK